jgi:hypothetical protein
VEKKKELQKRVFVLLTLLFLFENLSSSEFSTVSIQSSVLKPDKNDSDHRKLQPSPSGVFLGAGRTPATMELECRFFQQKAFSVQKREPVNVDRSAHHCAQAF